MYYVIIGLGENFHRYQTKIIRLLGRPNILHFVDQKGGSLTLESGEIVPIDDHVQFKKKLKKIQLSSCDLKLVIATNKFEDIVINYETFSEFHVLKYKYFTKDVEIIIVSRQRMLNTLVVTDPNPGKPNLKNKQILITGTSSGIGLELAKKLLEHEARVHGVSRREPELHSQNFSHHKIDLSNLSDLAKNSDLYKSKYDVVYLNAGVSAVLGASESWDFESVLRIFKINFLQNIILLNHLVSRNSLNSGATIIFTTTSMQNSYENALYITSKHAIDAFLIEFSIYYRDRIKFIAYLDPGWLKTEMGGEEAPGEIDSIFPAFLIPFVQEKPKDNLFKISCGDYAYLSFHQFIDKLKVLQYF